jgi:hypothetical protein
VGKLVETEGIMAAHQYIDILDESLMVSMEELIISIEKRTF